MVRSLARWAMAAAVALTMCVSALPAGADDVADEADLKFSLGAEAYQRGDYRTALEHFHASNRLSPNRNVLFNIARCYEQLAKFPEAFRYYTQALDGEPDKAARERIEAILTRLRANVALFEVSSDPAGATLYIDRRDLGARGESPRSLGLLPGRYKIIAERHGYYPAETTVENKQLGSSVQVRLKLEPILGKVKIEGEATGAAVHVDDVAAEPRCRVPCTIELPPGRHTLLVEQPGFSATEVSVDVEAKKNVTVRPRLERLTGTIVVSTDERGALIEVDGVPMGFTPAILTLPVGEHRIRLSLEGFRAIERAVLVKRAGRVRVEAALAQAEEVTAAARVTQSVEEAPSSVTIIPRLEIRSFAYPTLAEALRGVRGVYSWDDRSYVSLGFRGLGRLGSYGNRVLVLIDGHPANDNWIGSSYVGYDSRTDLGDVERIEVVRGPGSVLYGTNAFSGVINVVTRQREVARRIELGVSAADYGVGRARVRTDARLGRDAAVWTSAAAAHGEGRDFFFPELVAETPAENAGHARSVDGFRAGTLAGRATWSFVTAQWFLHSYSKQLPTAGYETLLADPRTRQTDTRGFVEARVEPRLSDEVQLLTRVHLNHYRFRGLYPRSPDDGGLEVDTFAGSWAGLEQRVVLTPIERLRLTVGGEGQLHFQVEQQAADEDGVFLDDSRPFEVGAAYLLADGVISPRISASGGVRLDAYSTFGRSLNPRAAVILKPYERGNTKLLGGKAFRAPSVYELYYNDAGITQLPSPGLNPESIYSVEIEHSHEVSPTVTAIAATYANYVTSLIATRGGGSSVDPLYYANSSNPLLTLGVELGVRREWRQGWMVSATVGYQRSLFLESESADDLFGLNDASDLRRVENSPEAQASIKGAVPLLSRAATLASRLSFEGLRYDAFERETDSPQQSNDPALLWDVVFSAQEQRSKLSYSIGIYNAFDWQYSWPVSREFRQRSILQNGRTLLLSLELAL
jgi:outer membrane receptor for ferrienterochelin and colicin